MLLIVGINGIKKGSEAKMSDEYNIPSIGLFGCRCLIPHGNDKRPFVYRIVNSGTISNGWCEPPLTYQSECNVILHDHSEPILIVVCDTLINENSKLIRVALKDVELMPEQKHGHWIEQDDYNDTYYKCSVCGEPWVLIDGTPLENGMHFCPKCGARMESEVKQDES